MDNIPQVPGKTHTVKIKRFIPYNHNNNISGGRRLRRHHHHNTTNNNNNNNLRNKIHKLSVRVVKRLRKQ